MSLSLGLDVSVISVSGCSDWLIWWWWVPLHILLCKILEIIFLCEIPSFAFLSWISSFGLQQQHFETVHCDTILTIWSLHSLSLSLSLWHVIFFLLNISGLLVAAPIFPWSLLLHGMLCSGAIWSSCVRSDLQRQWINLGMCRSLVNQGNQVWWFVHSQMWKGELLN